MAAAIPWVVGGLMAYNAYNNSKDQEAALRQQAQQLRSRALAERYNALVLRQRADQVVSATNQREEMTRREQRYLIGQARAASGESGLAGGSVDLSLDQSEFAAELDALNVRYEGSIEERGLRQDAVLADWSASQSLEASQFALRQASRVNRYRPLNVGASALAGYYGAS